MGRRSLAGLRWARVCVPAVAAALSLGAATPALAGTVAVTGTTLSYTAGAGEVNELRLRDAGGGTLAVYDDSADMSGGAGCTETGPGSNEFQCSPSGGAFAAAVFTLGDRDDQFFVSTALSVPLTVDGGAGADALDGGDGPDALTGGPGADSLFGENGNDVLAGGDDADFVDGDAGNDSLSGGAGGDNLVGGLGDDALNGDEGNDVLTMFDDPNGLTFGTPNGGNDVANGGPGEDTADYFGPSGDPVAVSIDDVANDGLLSGGQVDDIRTDVEDVTTGAGNDFVVGSAGPNAIDAGDGNDSINSGDGADNVSGAGGDDTILGGGGNDALDGGPGTDVVSGEAGDDHLFSAAGADILNGGDGSDTADFSASGLNVAVTLNGVADDGQPGQGANALTENVVTGGGNDAVTGDGARNVITTGAGDDTVNVAGDPGRADNVSCGAGNDAVTADADDDVAQLAQTDKCESINAKPVTGTPPTVQVPTPAPADTKAAKLSLSKCQKTSIRFSRFLKGVACTVKPNEAVRLTFQLRVKTRRATIADVYDLVLAEKAYARSSKTRRPTLEPSRKVLGKNRRFKVRMTVVAVDRGGNRTTRTTTFQVTR